MASVKDLKHVSSFFHHALIVFNISTFIKVTLDLQTRQYITWSTLFKIHARAYQVLKHILPSDVLSHSSLQITDPDLWFRFDAIIIQRMLEWPS